MRDAVQNDGAANHRRVCAEATRPKPVTDQENVGSTWLVVLGQEQSTGRGRNSENLGEHAGRKNPSGKQFGFCYPRQGRSPTVPNGDILEDVRLLSQVVKVRISQPLTQRSAATRVVCPHGHQPIGLWKWKGPQENPVDHAEDRRIGPDAETQRQRHHDGEAGVLDRGSHGIADISHHTAHHVSSICCLGRTPPARGHREAKRPSENGVERAKHLGPVPIPCSDRVSLLGHLTECLGHVSEGRLAHLARQ